MYALKNALNKPLFVSSINENEGFAKGATAIKNGSHRLPLLFFLQPLLYHGVLLKATVAVFFIQVIWPVYQVGTQAVVRIAQVLI